jgi:nucleotide sugar dehydrogenase
MKNAKNGINMKVSVIGLGYVGLPLACAIAKHKEFELVGFDSDKRKIEQIQNGICPIDDFQCEEDLKVVNLVVSSDPDILSNSSIYIVCVPTPVENDYTPDLRPVKNATATVAKYIQKGQILVIESTINPGVCDEVVIPIVEEMTGMKAQVDFDVAHCPERINPGDPIWNVYNIPRNIGSTSPGATKKTADFYRKVINAEINEMPDLKTAEATKIIENTFRDINIAYVNELAKSFDVLDIDLIKVIEGAKNKPFAFMAHYPSCGVGGHCIPVDPYYLIERAQKSGFDHQYLKLARKINNSMPEYTVELLFKGLNSIAKSIKNTPIALLGLSYKADVRDQRESPSLKIKAQLMKFDADLIIYDPNFPEECTYSTLQETLDKADAVVLAVNHKEFVEYLTAENFKKHNIKVIIDGKNMLDKDGIKAMDIYYKGIGR